MTTQGQIASLSIRVRVRVTINRFPEIRNSKIYFRGFGECNEYVGREWVESTENIRIFLVVRKYMFQGLDRNDII